VGRGHRSHPYGGRHESGRKGDDCERERRPPSEPSPRPWQPESVRPHSAGVDGLGNSAGLVAPQLGVPRCELVVIVIGQRSRSRIYAAASASLPVLAGGPGPGDFRLGPYGLPPPRTDRVPLVLTLFGLRIILVTSMQKTPTQTVTNLSIPALAVCNFCTPTTPANSTTLEWASIYDF